MEAPIKGYIFCGPDPETSLMGIQSAPKILNNTLFRFTIGNTAYYKHRRVPRQNSRGGLRSSCSCRSTNSRPVKKHPLTWKNLRILKYLKKKFYYAPADDTTRLDEFEIFEEVS